MIPNLKLMFLGGFVLLCGCTTTPTEMDSAQHIDVLAQDQKALGFDDFQHQTIHLTLNDALRRGAEKNLDAYVAALETLAAEDQIDLARMNALPSLNLNASYIGRSNKGAASSRSVLTNTQSLEPSYSTQSFRDTQDLSVNWTTLNILLAVSQAQNAKAQQKIAIERYNKVVQNIQKDIYAAYYRALAAQKTEKESDAIFRQAQELLQNIKTAENKKLLSREVLGDMEQDIQESLTALRNSQSQISLAMTELKSLLSYPQNINLKLSEDMRIPSKEVKALLAEDIETLEAEAIKNRPEIREQVLQRDVNLQNLREEIIRTVPGAELLFGINRDGNDFLRQNQWGSFTLSLQQNLSALITYPLRKRGAKNQMEIDNAKRLSLTLAVMTQVHLARQRLDYFYQLTRDRQKEYENEKFMAYALEKKSGVGFETKQDAFIRKMQAQSKKISYYQSLTDLQDAYATFQNTLARDIVMTH